MLMGVQTFRFDAIIERLRLRVKKIVLKYSKKREKMGTLCSRVRFVLGTLYTGYGFGQGRFVLLRGLFVGGRFVEGTLCRFSPTISISRETIATETRNRGIDNMIEALMEQFGPQKVKLH